MRSRENVGSMLASVARARTLAHSMKRPSLKRPSAPLMGLVMFGLVGCVHTASPHLIVYPQPPPDPRAFLSPFVAEWFLRGELAMEGRDFRAAAHAFRTALSGSEEDVLVIARLAVALDAAGDTEGRDAALDRAEAMDRDSEALWLARGAIAERRGQTEEALDAYRRASLTAPDSDAPVFAATTLLVNHGFPGRAAEDLAGFGRGPGLARVKLALALSRRDATSIMEALATLRDQTEIRSVDACDAAHALWAAGDPFSARLAIDTFNASDQCLALWVHVLAASGTREELEAALVRIAPNPAGDPFTMARLYLSAGRAETAEALVEASGSDPEALLIVGPARLAQGRYASAAEAFSQIAPETSAFEQSRVGLRAALEGGGAGHLALEIKR